MQLSVPNRTAPKSGSFDSNPASVRKWIDALPMANIGETTRLLFEALTDLNHQDIAAQQRFKTLELLYRPVRYVTERMKKHFVGQPLPPSPSSLKIAKLSREISHALATGYKVLVMEQIAGIGRKDKKLLVTAIHRAIKQLSAVLLKAYQVYEPYPDSVWLEVHSLYRYAENNRLHKTKEIFHYCGCLQTDIATGTGLPLSPAPQRSGRYLSGTGRMGALRRFAGRWTVHGCTVCDQPGFRSTTKLPGTA
jgi:hypothetical protein